MDVLRETQIGSFPKDSRVIINRFTYNESGRVKLLSSVDFPSDNLQVSDHIYDLGAYLEHHRKLLFTAGLAWKIANGIAR